MESAFSFSLQDFFTWSVSTRIFGFYGIPHLNLSVCVNDNFDRHTNRFENNITQECKEPQKKFLFFWKNLWEKLEISLVGAPTTLSWVK